MKRATICLKLTGHPVCPFTPGNRGSVIFTYVIVVAISAFIPYVATPTAEAGVKAVVSHHNDMETTDAATPVLVTQDNTAAPAQPREAH